MRMEFDVGEQVIELYGEDGVEAMMGMYLERLIGADKLPFDKDKPARAPHYLAYVRQLHCVVCGAQPPNQAHHTKAHGMGTKTDDFRTVPLCHGCHREVHAGNYTRHMDAKAVDTLVRYLRIVEGL